MPARFQSYLTGIETHIQLMPLNQLSSSNRTLQELKPIKPFDYEHGCNTSNRTLQELKQIEKLGFVAHQIPSNRTLQELKRFIAIPV